MKMQLKLAALLLAAVMIFCGSMAEAKQATGPPQYFTATNGTPMVRLEDGTVMTLEQYKALIEAIRSMAMPGL